MCIRDRQETEALAQDVSNYSPVITVMAAENPVKNKEEGEDKKTYTVKELSLIHIFMSSNATEAVTMAAIVEIARICV